MGHIFSRPQRKLGVSQGDVATEDLFRDSNDDPVYLQLPGGGKLSNRAFRLKLWGRVTCGTTGNLTLALQFATDKDVALYTSNTDIFTTAAQACNSQSASFHAEFVFTWDATSQKLQGRCVDYGIDDVASATLPAVATEIASIDPDEDDPDRYFMLTALHSATHASNDVILDGFQLEIE